MQLQVATLCKSLDVCIVSTTSDNSDF